MPDRDSQDTDALPLTEPHPAPIFDTGPHPQPLTGSAAAWSRSAAASSVAVAEPGNIDPPASGANAEPPTPVPSRIVPGHYHSLTWWKLVLVLAAVWVPAAGVGLGLFTWWFSLLDKTPAVFVLLIYVVVCTVAGVMLAMVEGRPLVSALAIAVMSAVYASMIAAAPLYGHHYCQHVSRCLAGIIPY